MKNSLYDRNHLKEYLLFGSMAAAVYMIPSLVFFEYMDYTRLWIIFSGSVLFMFVIMLYVFKLSRRKPEYKSAWMMIVAAHCAVLVGIFLSVVFTILLCFLYIPGFMSGDSENILRNASGTLNSQNSNLLLLLFLCATVENFGAAGFMAVLGPYVFKRNQTKDKTAVLEQDFEPGAPVPSKGQQDQPSFQKTQS